MIECVWDTAVPTAGVRVVSVPVAKVCGGLLVNGQLDFPVGGQQFALRLDGHLMHVVAAGKLAKTLPSPVPPEAYG